MSGASAAPASLWKVLVVGGGGREHALAWKLRQSPRVAEVFVAPGNGGTARETGLQNLPITDVTELRMWAQREGVDLTVVGPEAPLAAGVVDEFRAHGLRIFGPTRQAAQLESSKAFSKAFMERHGIPTAQHQTFSDPVAAHAYVDRMGAPIVVKADGLAAGKGVVVAMDLAEAHQAIDFMLLDDRLGVMHNTGADGQAQPRVVIEQYLAGEEASFIVLCDGVNVLPLATSQDHKRLLDGDQGPNTGGMGAYSPAPVVTPEVHRRAMDEIIHPTLAGMARDGVPYTGFLYAGLMIAPDGAVRTLEFNCRLGDPETQPILMRLRSDLAEVLWAATEQGLDRVQLDWSPQVALGVVLAAHGYPMQPRKDDAIARCAADAPDLHVFHAGTTLDGDTMRTSGGRVLCVTALGADVAQASARAQQAIAQTAFDGMQWRRDIGHRAMAPGPRGSASPALAQTMRDYLLGLQRRITDAVRDIDGGEFVVDPWHKPPGEALQGQGVTMILEGGAVFERAGCGFSHVSGPRLPPSATQHRPELAGAPFEAMGVSLVFHPRNPYVPTVHMNVRMISAQPAHGEAVQWFGGGMDLTPYYGFDEDAAHFHRVCRDALTPFGADKYPRFKRWCDDYFCNKHRAEQRGVGGVFFDDFSELGADASLAMTQAVGDAFLQAYRPIVERRLHTPYGERERDFQLYRRGRYVEFNLVWDRGTHFGLQSGGRSESILLSMPPLVSWSYNRQPEPGSAEERLTRHFLVPRDWV